MEGNQGLLVWKEWRSVKMDQTKSRYNLGKAVLNSMGQNIIFLHEEPHVDIYSSCRKIMFWDFPGGAVVKNPPSNAGDAVRSLVRELDPTCMVQLRVRTAQLWSPLAATKTQRIQNK